MKAHGNIRKKRRSFSFFHSLAHDYLQFMVPYSLPMTYVQTVRNAYDGAVGGMCGQVKWHLDDSQLLHLKSTYWCIWMNNNKLAVMQKRCNLFVKRGMLGVGKSDRFGWRSCFSSDVMLWSIGYSLWVLADVTLQALPFTVSCIINCISGC